MLRHATLHCDGMYWFRLFPRYWDTTRLGDGRYDFAFARGTSPATWRTPTWSLRSQTASGRHTSGNRPSHRAAPGSCRRR